MSLIGSLLFFVLSFGGAMHPLAQKKCIPCHSGGPPLSQERAEAFVQQLEGDWRLIAGHHIERELRFANFREALEYVNLVGALAESEGHHPDLELGWGRVKISFWTHKIDGLSESDFIMAAKCDLLLDSFNKGE